MDNLLKKIMSFDPGENDTHIDAQGRDFNAGQNRILEDAQKYLDMNNSDTLGGKSRETFETMEQTDQTIQQYQRQVSEMGRAHNQMMRETSELIKFINNPKYRGQTVTIQEVAKSGKALITNGKPITGYVNSSSVFLPSSNARKTNNVIKVTFEEPELIGKKTVPTKAGDPKLYIAEDASSSTPLFLFTGSSIGNISGLLGATTGNSLSPNIGKNNLDGASSNLFIKNAVDTDPSSINYAGCVDLPSGDGWVKASGVSNNWSFDTCKALADSQGSKQFAMGAESWKLNVIHAGSALKDYSGSYVCGPGMSNDRIAYRNITYNGKDMPVRLLLYPDVSQYFDTDGNVLGYLGGSTPWMTPQGPPFGPVKNCWPTFLHPEKLNYYITYVIEDKIWLLVEDVSCAEVAPGDNSIDEPTFFSSACIKPGLAKRGTGCNVWAGKWTDGCAGGAGNVINVLRAPAAGAPGIGHVAAGTGGASASQWGSGKNAGSPLIFGEDCVTVYQLGSEPFPTSASKSISEGPKWLAGSAQWVAANGDGTGPPRGSLSYYLKGTLSGTAPNVSIKWENGCTWTANNADGNAFVNFEAPTSKVIATKDASKSRNPLGEWKGSEKITVLLSVGCWYSAENGAKTTADNAIVVAGHFDGKNTILFDIPDKSSGMVVGVDGLLYGAPYTVLGADSMVSDKTIHKNTDSQIDSGAGGDNMVKYYSNIGDKQSTSLCAYHPTFQEDGYPVLKNIKMDFNKTELNAAYSHDDMVRFKKEFVTNFDQVPLSTDKCGGMLNGANTSCSDVAPGRTCKNVNLEDAAIDAEQLADYAAKVAETEVENAESWLQNLFGGHKSQKAMPKVPHPDAHQELICHREWNAPAGSQRWKPMGGSGGDTTKAGATFQGLLDEKFTSAWPQLQLKCQDAIPDTPDMVDQNIAKATAYDGQSSSYGKFVVLDETDIGKGGTYSVGTELNAVCNRGNIGISGTYNCGNYVNDASTTNVTGSSVTMSCPGKNICDVYLYLSDFGELMMMKGDYRKSPAGTVLWKTEKIGVKTGIAVPNPEWKTASNAFKMNGEPVPYIPGNGIPPKGSFLLSSNGVFRFTYGTPLKGDPEVLSSDNWATDFLARFQIMENIPSSKTLLTTTAGGGGMMGGSETTCDSCAVIEYSVESCGRLPYVLKFDDKTGLYVLPADKTTHKYSLSGSEVALYNNPNANNTGLYSTFYVDEYNVPFVLNPDALSYDESDDYIYFGKFSLGVVESANASFKVPVGNTPSDTEKSCLQYLRNDKSLSSPIKAFNLDISTGEVWLFPNLTPSMELLPPEVNMRPGLRLYMKKPSRVLDTVGQDCSAMVFPAGSKDIVGQAGGPWTNASLAGQTNLPKKCNLPRNMDGIQNTFYDKYEAGAMAAGKQLAAAIPGLEETRDTLAKGLSSSREDIDNTMATYEDIYKKVLTMMTSQTADGQLESSQLKLVEDNYQYIIWSVLAIALVMFAMSLHRK